MSRRRRIEDLEREMESMARTLEALKTWPKEPKTTFDGPPAVVIFEKTFGSRTHYHYAAISAGGRWYLTGNITRSFSWEELLDFVDSATSTMMEAGSWVSLRRDHVEPDPDSQVWREP